jgi:phospholipase/carboxylesterase
VDDARTLSIDDDLVVWSVPADGLAEAFTTRPLVIVMHGKGSHERDLAGLFGYLPGDAVYASLRAPLVSPQPIVNGFEWFPIGVPGDPSADVLNPAADAVLAWLDRVVAAYGAPRAVAAMGFSQGGAMSIQLLRTAPERISAGVNLSGFAASAPFAGDDVLADTKPPLFWGFDRADPIIAQSAIVRTAQFVPGHFTATIREYPGIAHSISGEELGDVAAFLTSALGLAR